MVNVWLLLDLREALDARSRRIHE